MENQFDNTPEQTENTDTIPEEAVNVSAEESSNPPLDPITESVPVETESDQPKEEVKAEEKVIYTDPNAGVVQPKPAEYEGQYQYGQNAGSGQPNQQYNSNFEYNTSSGTTGYKADYYTVKEDTSPMSLGDWLLTILALMIPCAGIILYFVWAFGKDVNVNRRNYCRAALIVQGAMLVLSFILMIIMFFGIAASGNYYY